MYKIKFTTAYKKSYQRMVKRGANIELLDDVVDMLRQGKSLPLRYKDHPLKGAYSKFRECHIAPNWLLVYMIKNNILTLTLIDTGTHSDIFRE